MGLVHPKLTIGLDAFSLFNLNSIIKFTDLLFYSFFFIFDTPPTKQYLREKVQKRKIISEKNYIREKLYKRKSILEKKYKTEKVYIRKVYKRKSI